MCSAPNNASFSILALARAGALGLAWREFRRAGFDNIHGDPGVLSLKGRLLKDEGRKSSGLQRKRFYGEAADAYARAAELSGRTYPLINAATLALLARQPAKAKKRAREVLARLADNSDTPYWQEATRAEALLLLGDVPKARQAFAQAIAIAPNAFEDHASTLRQFGLILEVTKHPAKWLDNFRPPRSLHFGGPMNLSRGDETALPLRIRRLLQSERVGTAFGALGAGADLLIAEALLEGNVELHAILPLPVDAFRKISVARYGTRWVRRFERVLARLASCRCLPPESGAPFPLAVQLAAEVAMGRSAMEAELLQTEAIQLAILAERGSSVSNVPGSSGWMRSHWQASGRRSRTLYAIGKPAQPYPMRAPDFCLAATLRLELPEQGMKLRAKLLKKVCATFADAPSLVTRRFDGEAIELTYQSPKEAMHAGLLLRRRGLREEIRIAGHYGFALRINDLFKSGTQTISCRPQLVRQIALSTPPGGFSASEDFAAALRASDAARQVERLGELPGRVAPDEPIGIFSIG